MNYKYLYPILFLFLLSCKKEVKEQQSTSSKGDIVLIFDKMPENWQYKIPIGWVTSINKADIEYRTQLYNPQYYITQDSTKTDTLFIKNVEQTIELLHTYKALDKFSYLVKPNDTVLFTYEGRKPIARLLNKRATKKYDLNYDLYIREAKIIKEDYPCILKQKEKTSFLYIDLAKDNIIEFCEQKRELAKNELYSEKKFLDSIYTISQISKDIYQFYTKRIEYNLHAILLAENSREAIYDNQDSLLLYSYYRDYLKTIAEYKIEKYVAHSPHSNLFTADNRSVFDSILQTSIFDKNEKKYLLSEYLEPIYKHYSFDVSKTHYTKLKSEFNTDTFYLKQLEEKYKLDENYSLQLDLLDQKGKSTTFETVIKENKGYVIYVDFWASWCSPCRANIKNATEIKAIYKDKKVKFIYLNLNDEVRVWEKAMNELSLTKEENYLIKNYKRSKLINDFNINTIPRYFIIDKTGAMVNSNAPRPDSKEVKNEIDKYLKP